MVLLLYITFLNVLAVACSVIATIIIIIIMMIIITLILLLVILQSDSIIINNDANKPLQYIVATAESLLKCWFPDTGMPSIGIGISIGILSFH